MRTVSVSQIKAGDKLLEAVNSRFGNALFYKGRILTERDTEILKAFLISTVTIDNRTSNPGQESAVAVATADIDTKQISSFDLSYDHMLQLLKKAFGLVLGNSALPVLEMRNELHKLIEHIEGYQVLTFTPRQFQLQDFVYHNSIMVSLTAYLLAKWHGLPQKDWIQIALAGLLHDIGNAKIDQALLVKPTKLTSVELEEMRKHTLYGYNVLKPIAALNEGVKLCSLQHHEREDASGYPLGLKSDQIHIYSKVVAVADIFHAMTSVRYHQEATSPYLVLEQLSKDAFGKVDPAIVNTFINKVTSFHTGTIVRLNDNRVGEIVFSDRSYPTRPWVNINGTIINLTLERNLYIQEVIDAR
ncbi:HD-GYP domain-containing protein [Paenibacillus sp. UNC499MF]|uniref:HD-GYP domain-containing protein n=1 Tax=Paenibacillus sp. UNC499MF TaxID=1502751 RepID=UPI00089F8DA1|nr:HD-GYP domain-containing protein [Paenibacillus sp. UNC499MF]SEG22002.1 HD-GYP domain, c-di-GMP phosphodiesterase class II (or its inactivated variant) [Paenibacillus sp. UNC499MF]